MRSKKSCFFLVLLLFSTLTCSVGASSDTTVTFRGAGVTIDLTFPDEAHPEESIWHNATLTANTDLTLYNLTVVIKAPVDSTWQETTGWYLFNRQMQESETRMEEMYFQLPSNANGTLQCFIFVNTSQSTDYLSTTFYTTRVSELTFSEMQSLYNEMLANYTSLQADYETLLGEYDELLANYSTLFANYTALLSQYDALSAQYNAQVATYQSLLDDYNDLSEEYATLDNNYRSKIADLGDLQLDYDSLNSTRYSLQANFTSLQADYDALNQTYTDLQTELTTLQEDYDISEGAVNSSRIVMFIFIVTVAALIAFIFYIKRKKEEPYLVIRKETVSVKSDEDT
jgi:predicted nuclease with TOPRIM domain